MTAFVHRLTSSLTLADLPDTDGLPNPPPGGQPGGGGGGETGRGGERERCACVSTPSLDSATVNPVFQAFRGGLVCCIGVSLLELLYI